jgi:hypothetical protein
MQDAYNSSIKKLSQKNSIDTVEDVKKYNVSRNESFQNK